MKILLYPHPKDMWGGQRSPEHTSRMAHTIKVWRELSLDNEVWVYCSGGLPNRTGLTLAQDMAAQLMEIEPKIGPFLIIGEQNSTHTGQAVCFSSSYGYLIGWDRIIIISNRWHLLRIGSYLQHYMVVPHRIEKAPSPSWGQLFYQISRTVQELILYLDSLIFDRFGHRFDKLVEKRRADALRKP